MLWSQQSLPNWLDHSKVTCGPSKESWQDGNVFRTLLLQSGKGPAVTDLTQVKVAKIEYHSFHSQFWISCHYQQPLPDCIFSIASIMGSLMDYFTSILTLPTSSERMFFWHLAPTPSPCSTCQCPQESQNQTRVRSATYSLVF